MHTYIAAATTSQIAWFNTCETLLLHKELWFSTCEILCLLFQTPSAQTRHCSMAWYSTAFLHAVCVHMKVNKDIFTNTMCVGMEECGYESIKVR